MSKHIVTIFNKTLNTEDVYTVSKEFVELDAFSWSGYINFPFSKNAGYPAVRMVLRDQN